MVHASVLAKKLIFGNGDLVLKGDALWSNPSSNQIGFVGDCDLLIREDTKGLSATDLILAKNA